MRLRDTRVQCIFGDNTNPIILRESCWREETFQSLSAVSLCSVLEFMLYFDLVKIRMKLLLFNLESDDNWFCWRALTHKVIKPKMEKRNERCY